ncbi:MAG: hypothetical protein HYU33_07320, partial [Candidatus Omnitrophica bacterium]|nr:hypothetical protein [Candidatus Omnitrophota bacterium]
ARARHNPPGAPHSSASFAPPSFLTFSWAQNNNTKNIDLLGLFCQASFPFSGYEIDPGGTVTKYIKIGNEIVGASKGGEKLFYHNDHLGGVNVITDIWATRVQLVEYDPWGKVSREEGASEASRRFTGKMLDPESGLYYYGGRYYDPELGRFISPDPFVPQPSDPQSLNRYSYVENNPVNHVDPSGYKKKKKGGFFRSFFGKLLVSIVAAAILSPAASVLAHAAAVANGATLSGAIAAGTFAGKVAAGIAAGATAAGLSGGDPGIGALLGGFAGMVGGPGFNFRNTPIGTFASEIVNDFSRGFAIGTVGSLATGRKFSDALVEGLTLGAFSAGGAQFNNLIGHTVGFIASGGQGPEFRDGGFFYKTSFGSAISIGNAITYNAEYVAYPGAQPTNILEGKARLGDRFADYNIRTHELGHIPASRLLGAFALPAHILSQGGSRILSFGQSSHRYNLLERFFHPAPSFD